MQTITLLMDEHRLLERVCAALVAFGDEQRRLQQVDDRSELQRFLEFIHGFSDDRHHRKEQEVLFPAMIAAPPLRDTLQSAGLLEEHDRVRSYASVLHFFAKQPRPWRTDDRNRLDRSTRAYAELMREHIDDEESTLFPLAERHLETDAKVMVDSVCEQIDAESGIAAAVRLRLLGEELMQRHRALPRA